MDESGQIKKVIISGWKWSDKEVIISDWKWDNRKWANCKWQKVTISGKAHLIIMLYLYSSDYKLAKVIESG